MTNPEDPQQLGNYRLIRRLGSGGFADVYLGEHIHLGKQAAIKVLKLQEDKTGQADFLEEARRAVILQHPNIISILDFGIENDRPFLVMDYAPFGTLLKRHPRSTRVALETVQGYVRQVASALQYAHQLKVIHRDVKPENMLIGTGGKILLGDFGIAIVAHRPETMSAQVAAGTAVYMAPEQARGFACPESDQYALAIVVYEWLCGFSPFTGTSLDRLRELLHERLALHIAKQQQVLFWQGEKARRRRDYTEARRLWQELQQQNGDFVTTNFVSGKKIAIARYLELLVIEQAKRAERVGDWQQAQTLWQEVKGTWPSNRQAPGRLKNATLNLRYAPTYQQAEQYVAQKQIEQAKPLLEEVWKNAPRFGDPAKLAKPTGLYSPLLSVDVVFNICLVGGLGVFVSLLDQTFLHGSLLISQLWGLLAALVVASIVIFMMFNVRKGKPVQYGAIVLSGCIITVVTTLVLIQH